MRSEARKPKTPAAKALAAVEATVEAAAAALPFTPKPPTFHGKVSLRSHLAHTFGPVTLKPILGYAPLVGPVFFALRNIDKIVGALPSHSGVTRVTIDTPTWAAHLYTPRNQTCEKTIVYFHGGAFLSCGLGTHRRIVEHLADLNGCSILSVAYRQYPEVNFDATVQDCREAVEWLLEKGYSADGLVLAGDSAGGGLAVRLGGDLMDAGHRVAGVIALSGWLDFDAEAKRDHPWGRKDAYIPASRLENIARMVLGRHPKLEDSPVAAIREGYPPLLLICGANEILRIDSEEAYRRCGELGVDCEAHYFRGGIHAFPVATSLFPEGPQAQELMRQFIATLPR